MQDILSRVFRNDPAVDDAEEKPVHIAVAGLAVALLAGIILVRKGLGGSAAM